jgi:hypothetical protein
MIIANPDYRVWKGDLNVSVSENPVAVFWPVRT